MYRDKVFVWVSIGWFFTLCGAAGWLIFFDR